MSRFLPVLSVVLFTQLVVAGDFLVRLEDSEPASMQSFLKKHGGELKLVSREGHLYKWTSALNTPPVRTRGVRYIQRNFKYSLFESPSLTAKRPLLKAALRNSQGEDFFGAPATDNPPIASPGTLSAGSDPLTKKSWGLSKIGAASAWSNTAQGDGIIVAVTDSGVDYNHEDLINNMWRNPGEIAGDGIDNDGNGFVDDIVGWDFFSNDALPFDLTVSLGELLTGGGNPGHGTHVSGVVGALLQNKKGTAGVAPKVKIMALRFLGEKGEGTSEGGINAIDYAVSNGAKIINASWGGESGEEDDQALKEAIERAQANGVIFVAAAGNGRSTNPMTPPAGFDNDNDAHPMVPVSLGVANIVGVAATDSKDQLAEFSNWGRKSVLLAAPGVKIMSTVPGNKYQDTIIDLGSGMTATWDGTSMAAPFVSGALAVVWSENPSMTADEVIGRLASHASPVSALKTKVVTGGRLDISTLTE